MRSQLNRLKPYKAIPPLETVKRIERVLSGLGMTFTERFVSTNHLFKSLSLDLINPDSRQPVFSTFGKGISQDWARASAWGEMAERIQNLAFYMMMIYPSQPEINPSHDTDFKYFPDEIVFSPDYILDSNFNAHYKAIAGLLDGRVKKLIGVPFTDISGNKKEYFPFRTITVIVGSNGMCSGNTGEEAMIQGISEIFERFVLKTIYFTPFCPPDIPLSYFKGTQIYKSILYLTDRYGYQIRIKDCSMGKGYPVLGVLVRNRQLDYAFHLGADPSPITALERCFTEMFQDGHIIFQSINELQDNLPYNPDTPFWKRNLGSTISTGAGHWPDIILDGTPDYNFTGFDHPVSRSDQEDLEYLIQLIEGEGREVFFRDNSFLGQPAFYVYIPGMSEIYVQPGNVFPATYLEFDQYLPILTNLKKSLLPDRIKMLDLIKRYAGASNRRRFEAREYFAFFRDHPIAKLSSQQFMFLMNSSLTENDIETCLNSLVVDVPSCFSCEKCSLKQQCNFPFIASLWEKIKKRMEMYYGQVQLNSFSGMWEGYNRDERLWLK